MPHHRSGSEIWPTIRRFLPSLLVYWPRLLGIFALLLVAAVLELVRPYLIGRIVDLAASRQPWLHVAWILGIFLVAVVARSGVIPRAISACSKPECGSPAT